MSNNQSLIIDPTKLGDIAQVLPTPTLVSSPTNHQGILLMQYDQIPAHEVPEYNPLHHVVAVWGMRSQAKLETKFDDDYRWEGMFAQARCCWGDSGWDESLGGMGSSHYVDCSLFASNFCAADRFGS
jgi:hypothetical protein